MIISQTPLRVSLFGGGTDFADYYREHGGAVLSLGLARYVHVVVKPRWEPGIGAYHWQHEHAMRIDEIEHGIIRECLRITDVTDNVEITCLSDVPVGGSGLGASSSLTVGLLNALYAYRGERRTAGELAELACHIEIDVLGEPIGKQDQYAAAFGGGTEYRFHPDGRTTVHPLGMSQAREHELARHVVIFYTGRTRRAATILRDQKAAIGSTTRQLDRLKEMVSTGRALLDAGDIAGLGRMLDVGWQLKKTLADRIHDTDLDELYRRGMAVGAYGGKLLGAGGGGFFLFLCPIDRQPLLRAELCGLRELPFGVDHIGTTILVDTMAAHSRREPV